MKNYMKLALFAGGTLFGSFGIKLLSSKDAKKAYVHATAAGLRMKDSVMQSVTTVQENASDILASAKELNEELAAKDAEEAAAANLENEEDLLAGIEFLDSYLYPNMPDVFHQTSIFLVDSLYEERYSGYPEMIYPSVFQGMETLVVGNIPSLKGLGEDELRDSVNQILQYLTVSYLHSQNPDGIEDFYLVSSDLQSGRSYYETEVRQPYYPGDYCLEPARWEEYGFLNYDRDEYAFVEGDMEYWSYSLPDQETDLGDFVMVILGYEPEEFEAQYVQYPKVIEKYTLLREILIREGII